MLQQPYRGGSGAFSISAGGWPVLLAMSSFRHLLMLSPPCLSAAEHEIEVLTIAFDAILGTV